MTSAFTKMNKRIKILRELSLNTPATLSGERAELLSKFYQSEEIKGLSIPEQRGAWLKYFFTHKELYLHDLELIVGERGPSPKATPTYPEICIHTLDDLETLNNREKQNFKVDRKTKEIFRNTVIPFWEKQSMREKIFSYLPEEWITAYEAGVFTEFQEQRAPGHTVPGKDMYHKGFREIIDELDDAISDLDFINDEQALEKLDELKAMKLAAEAVIIIGERYAKLIEHKLHKEVNETRRQELKNMLKVCKRVPENKPETFHQALQHYWFIHLGVISEVNPWDSFNPGRLDQNLYPFYKQDIKNGRLTKDEAIELLQAFWIKFNNHPAPPKIGVTAQESSTYTDFALINIGGLTEDGNDGVNELSYILLDVIEEMRLLQPSSMVQVSKKNPDSFIQRAVKIIKTGFGQPSVFNTDAIIQELLRQGKSLVDARNGGASGCVETGAFGNESYILTGYFNIPKVLEITLNNGIDPQTGKLIGIESGNPECLSSFDELYAAFEKQLKYFIDIKIHGNNIIEKLWAKYLPVPFLSILINDCIVNGKDYNAGGARYNSSYIQGVGMGSISDELAALKYHIFEKQTTNLKTLRKALKNNFKDFKELREILLNQTPKYGNDNNYVDSLTQKVFNSYFNNIDGRPNTKRGQFRINLLPTTVHVYFGSKTGAMPDGRKAKEPLSEGISPVQGADRLGPTAVLKSAAKIEHLKTGGTLLNQKLTPQILETEKGIKSVVHLIRSYFRMDGHHIQFNVVTAETLKKAQQQPEKYRDLIVRVAGYSDYFVDLTKELQEEIIQRTEHVDY